MQTSAGLRLEITKMATTIISELIIINQCQDFSKAITQDMLRPLTIYPQRPQYIYIRSKTRLIIDRNEKYEQVNYSLTMFELRFEAMENGTKGIAGRCARVLDHIGIYRSLNGLKMKIFC